MPLFEFECKACKHRFEQFFHGGGKRNVRCPDCGSKGCTKLFSGFATKGAAGRGGASCWGCTSSSCTGCGR